MVESIAATSLLVHQPINRIYHRKYVPNKQKLVNYRLLRSFTKFLDTQVSWSASCMEEKQLRSIIKAQAMELTKEAYSYREKDRIRKDPWGQADTGMDNRPGLWPPENKADNPALNNPLLRQERMGCGWLGVIFEWEGVLVEDNPDHERQAWLTLALEEGKSPPPAFMLPRIEGMKSEQALGEVLCWSRDPGELKRMSSRKEDIYQALHGGNYKFRPGSQSFVSVLMNHKVPMALVSTRPRKYLEMAIAVIGFENVFSVIVAAEDVHRGKPDPEMYAYAGQLLQFIPERCIVIGNSNLTVEAARDARMKCVAVASKHRVYELGAADIVVTRLDELSVVDLKNLADIESPEFGLDEPEMEMEVEADDDRRSSSSSSGDFYDDFW
ncbi:Haloacid dehalogenase-like hydrolase (HAD) superfamily protein [Striga hermonthica]|uniref:Haloacid dehalogenase-like hydrolase (HAD) superfamily protein n=1 Tax=Striga hermonthica TaxID=68872 RepID=A0A9N7MSY2_STRHE|nr:Haloacid dehalogenase-like hydrolase (HAD) superfamily protein [Striga hermonthica]